MAQSTTISIRLEPAVKTRLDRLADSTRRSKSFLAAEAVRAFVELNEWQIQETHAALREADAGDFAKPSEVRKILRKWHKAA
jgi:RHH-type rel operon transcriptional repressor/antitoxin RelB